MAMKGWIEVTCKYDHEYSDLELDEIEQKLSLGIFKKSHWPEYYWKKNYIQIANIDAITWIEEVGEEELGELGNGLIHMEGVAIETKESHKEILTMIENNK